MEITVVHNSPSFLVEKPKRSHRFVTSFVELDKFIKPLPTKLSQMKRFVQLRNGSILYYFRTKKSYFPNLS